MVCLQEGQAGAPPCAPLRLTGETWELALAERRLVALGGWSAAAPSLVAQPCSVKPS